MEKRIGSLEFRKAIYIGEEPEHPSYHIDRWYPNPDYGRESEYIKDGNWYRHPDYQNYRKHKDCFKHPESCYTIASFVWDEHEGIYELHFVGDRPIELQKDERDVFWEIYEYGEKVMNSKNYEEDQ